MSWVYKVMGTATGLASVALLHQMGFKEEKPVGTMSLSHQSSSKVIENVNSVSLDGSQPNFYSREGIAPHDNRNLSIITKQLEDLVVKKLMVSGVPGASVAIAVDGKEVYRKGYGYSDIENRVPFSPDTVIRIASISKAVTMAAVAKLVENGKLDLDKPVKHFLPDWSDDKGDITTRQLVSHMSGIRHYLTKKKIEDEKKNGSKIGDGKYKEFYSNSPFESVSAALEIFKHDELLHKPGEKFHYTTHGFTLLSAVIEKVAGESFETHIQRTFRDLGLKNTFLDKNNPIIDHRSRYYIHNEDQLINAPNVDNSCKWAGGGFLSNVHDIIKFGNAMLYSFQQSEKTKTFSGFLKKDTMEMLWSPVARMAKSPVSLSDAHYGMGWEIHPRMKEVEFGRDDPFFVTHTGGAVGASSILLILPRNCSDLNVVKPSGIVVVILCNMQGVGLRKLALEIAELFADPTM